METVLEGAFVIPSAEADSAAKFIFHLDPDLHRDDQLSPSRHNGDPP